MMEKVNRESQRSRTYGQFCALARSLDIVGERWTLLIVRELLPGPMRYTELKTSLEGIATNLLAERLRGMEAHGIIERRLHESRLAYALTPWGMGLREPMEALGRWGAPLLATGRGGDAFQPRWLTLALPALLADKCVSTPVEIGIETGGLLMILRIDADGPSVFVGSGNEPETVLVAAPDMVVALAAGEISIEEALATSELRGDSLLLRAAFAGSGATADPPATDD